MLDVRRKSPCPSAQSHLNFMSSRLTADDFFTGLFSALALNGWSVISLREDRFDAAVARVFEKLESVAREKDLDLRFRVRLHPFHSDSSTVRDSVTNAVKRDLISLDNPVFQDIRLKMTKPEAHGYLSSLPGGEALFLELAQEFDKSVRGVARDEHEQPEAGRLPKVYRGLHKKPPCTLSSGSKVSRRV